MQKRRQLHLVFWQLPVLSDGLLQLIKLPLAVVINPKLPNIASNFFIDSPLIIIIMKIEQNKLK
jgi:hypothetical protein